MRTLVLNAGYEPLGVVSFKRALILVLNQKATILAGASDHEVHSVNHSMKLPSVILLSRYVRLPVSKAIPVTRRGVLRRDNWRCVYCSRPAGTVDHVQPKSKGGSDSWDNLVACCLQCNNQKGDKLLREIGWSLPCKPKMPSGTSWMIRGMERLEPEWDNFLQLSNAA